MAAQTRVPRAAHIHFDDQAKQFRVKMTWLDEATGDNKPGEVIEFLATLAQVLQLILQIWAAVSPTTVSADGDTTGNVSALAKWIGDNSTDDGKGIHTLGG
jgi:hypothetical protein